MLEDASPSLTRFTVGPFDRSVPHLDADAGRVAAGLQLFAIRSAQSVLASSRRFREREPLTQSPNLQDATGISPDGSRLIFTETTQSNGTDECSFIWMVLAECPRSCKRRAVSATVLFSPDGRWLAYEADESGEFEIYVRPYPAVNGGRWLISNGGGVQPSVVARRSRTFLCHAIQSHDACRSQAGLCVVWNNSHTAHRRQSLFQGRARSNLRYFTRRCTISDQ